MNWFSGSIPDAIAESRRNNKIFLVYVEGQDELSKKMTTTYNDPAVVEKLSPSRVVPLKLTANSQHYIQFSAIFPVLVIPSSFFIGRNGIPIEIITGSRDSSEFIKKIDSVFEIHNQDLASSPPQTNVINTPSPNLGGPSTSNASNLGFESSEPVIMSTNNVTLSSSATPAASEAANAVPEQSAEAKAALEDRLERAKALIEIRRQEELRKEQEKLKKDELERRNVGKAMQEAQKLKQENELQDLMKSRAKEKEEERLAREAVKAQIAQDRAERAAKYQQAKEIEQAEKEKMAHMREEQDRAARNAAMWSNEARLQFRLPDGSFTSHSFTADATLEEARQFVVVEVRPPFSNFTMCTTFPRRHFTESNYSETLRDLQLTPSAVLLILPAQAVTSIRSNGGFFTNIFWMLVSPFTSIWRFISSFFPGNSPRPRADPPVVAAQTQQQPSPERASNQSGSTSDSQAAHRRREGNFYKKEGNVFRINNQSDDDENNTWNGNSTQQM